MRGFVVSKALYTVAALGVADHLHEGPSPVEEVAARCEVDADALARLLRALCSAGVFVEGPSGSFALTPTGALLRSEPPSLRSWVLLNGSLLYRVFGEATDTFRTGQPASARVLGRSFFDHLAADPDDGSLFDAAMRDMTAGSARLLLDSCDLTGVTSVVDVGGGDGTLLTELLQASPAMSGVVVDLEKVVHRARQRSQAPELRHRLEFLAGDFFTSVPPGADVYVLAWILHDWDDEAASRILLACRRAMRSTSRLLILESVLPADESPHFSRFGDLVMMVLFNGRERTRDEFAELLRICGLTLNAVHTTSTPRSVLEVRVDGSGP